MHGAVVNQHNNVAVPLISLEFLHPAFHGGTSPLSSQQHFIVVLHIPNHSFHNEGGLHARFMDAQSTTKVLPAHKSSLNSLGIFFLYLHLECLLAEAKGHIQTFRQTSACSEYEPGLLVVLVHFLPPPSLLLTKCNWSMPGSGSFQSNLCWLGTWTSWSLSSFRKFEGDITMQFFFNWRDT